MADLSQAQGRFTFDISKLKTKKNSFEIIEWFERFVDDCANRNYPTNINFYRDPFYFDGGKIFSFTFDATGKYSYESTLEDMFVGDDEEMKSLLKEMDGLMITIHYGDMEFAHNFIGKGCTTIKVRGNNIVHNSQFNGEEITKERFIECGFGDDKEFEELLEWNSNMQE